MNVNLMFDNAAHRALYKHLCRLDSTQFKYFYGIFVRYWTNHKYFISLQNFFNLWCELNQACHDLDESFPDPYDDHEAIKSFCIAHPYYFIDKLPIDLIARLFAEYIDDRIDVLTGIANLLYKSDLASVFSYANNTLGLCESVDALAAEAIDHINHFSRTIY